MFPKIVLSVFVLCASSIMSSESTNSHHYCPDFQPQKSLDLEQLMGMWYGVEIVHHRHEKTMEGKTVVDTCPVLHFARSGPSSLRLLWNEEAGTVEYTFHIPDPTNPGFWMSSGPQNGSSYMTQKFEGTVQVMKAVGNHVVLLFCRPNLELFSFILSRHLYLETFERRGIKNLLNRRGLTVVSVTERCRNGGFTYTPSILLIVLAFAKHFSSF